MSHLKTKHSNLTSTKCSICDDDDDFPVKNFPIQNFIAHMKCHGLRSFECLYCEYADETTSKMKEHIHTIHSDKLAIIFIRNKGPEFKYIGARHLSQYNIKAQNAMAPENIISYMDPLLRSQSKYMELEYTSIIPIDCDIDREEKSLRIGELISKFN